MAKQNPQSSSVIDQKAVRPYYFLAALTAFLVLLASGGSFILKDIYKPFVPEHLIPEGYGQDLLSLLTVPVLVFSIYITKRNSVRGLILLSGTLLYIAYAYALYAFGAVYNGFFLVYIALVGLPIFSVVGILTNIQCEAYRDHIKPQFPVRAVSGYLMAVGVLIGIVWIVFLLRAMDTQVLSEGINSVYVLDLALLLPAFIVAAILLWRGKTSGYLLSPLLLVKAVTLGLSIMFGKVFAYAQGDTLSWGRVGMFGVITIIGVVIMQASFQNIKECA